MNCSKRGMVYLFLLVIVFFSSDVKAEKKVTKYDSGEVKTEETVDDSSTDKVVTTLVEYNQQGQVTKTKRTSEGKVGNEKRILIYSDYKDIKVKGSTTNEKKYSWANEKYTYYKDGYVNYKSIIKKDTDGNEIKEDIKGYYDGTKKLAYSSLIKRNSQGKRTNTVQVGYTFSGEMDYAEDRTYYENGFRKERKDYYYNLGKKHLIGIMQYDDAGVLTSKKIMNQEKLSKNK